VIGTRPAGLRSRGQICARGGWIGGMLLLGVLTLLIPRVASTQEESRQTGAFQVGKAEIAAIIALPHFYEMRDFMPAWTQTDDIDNFLRAAEEAYRDGLDPEDYHLSEIGRIAADVRAAAAPANEAIADLEMLLTDGFFRLVYHIEFGKVDPVRLDPSWNIYKDFGDEDPARWLESALGSPSVFEFIESKKSQHPLYSCLKATLEKYRRIGEEGGWEPVPAGETLKKGMEDDRVVALRERLSIVGDLPDTVSTTLARFDEDVERAVMRFQERHGLDADGAVGARTLEAMNVPVQRRIDQLRVNLERGRWVLQDMTDTFVLVNIAGFRVYYVRENKFDWSTRAQVGSTYRQTPVFRSQMEYLVFNPTWTVPPTILVKDVLPAIKKDMGYLTEKNMVVLDRSGRKVDPGAVDWPRFSGSDFPYVIRQEPGPGNALGQVKFIFPNEHFVFLHDTPSKSLFNKSERTFSSGCIRVENPIELARLLLDSQNGWDAAKFEQVIVGGKTQTVYLSRPLPTLLLYWTAFATLDGNCNFRNDVYGRDPAVLEALAGKPVIRKRHEAQRERPLGSGH
jgi:murein L,D-transpeptidase YcbB/YkuD